MADTTEAKQVCRAASALINPVLDFGIKPCGTYTREDLLEDLSRIAFDSTTRYILHAPFSQNGLIARTTGRRRLSVGICSTARWTVRAENRAT